MSKHTYQHHSRMGLSVLTLAILQASVAHAHETSTSHVAIDDQNIAHVVVNASLQNDPTTPSIANDADLGAKNLELQQSKTSDTATALTALTGMNVQSAGRIGR